MSAAVNRSKDNIVEVTDARATSVTNSPNQIISPHTLFYLIRGGEVMQTLQKDKATMNRKTVPGL